MSRGTPTMPFRIPLDVREKARARAEREGETLTAVVLWALQEYGEGRLTIAPQPPPPAR